MIGARDFYHMDLRLRKIMMTPDILSGGVCVILTMDPAQLPTVIDYSL